MVISGFIKLEVMEICNTGGEPLNLNTRNQEKKPQQLLNKIDFGISANEVLTK